MSLKLVHAVEADEKGWLLGQQLSAHASNLPASAIGNMINGAITVLVFYGSVSLTLMAACYLMIGALVLYRMYGTKDALLNIHDLAKLRRVKLRVELCAAALGLIWGTTTGLEFAYANPAQQMYLGILASGMLAAGTLTFRTCERAGRLYLAFSVPGYLYGFLSLGHLPGLAAAGLLIAYTVILFGNIMHNARVFGDSMRRERALLASSETIQLLLNDFEEQGSDWLIELDAEGRILIPRARLAEAAQRPIETIVNKPFVDLLDHGDTRDALVSHLKNKRAFRHHIVSLTIDSKQLWWSISVRPATDGLIAFRGVVTDITAQRHAEEKVSYMAHYDGLTGLPNRFTFNSSLYRSLARDRGVAGLMYLDLDHFKTINDTLGHPVGDQLLKAVARRLESCLSPDDLIARLGGDEFAVIVSSNRLDKLDALAQKIVESLNCPFRLGDHDVVIGVSVGIACAPEHAETPDDLLRNADLALYAAKTAGRNCATRFEPGMDEAAQQRRLIEMDLRGSLTKNEMRLHYQPLINAGTGETNGYEALIRWEHPTRGFVMPQEFIGIAEETGMIVQIGEWVIRQAIDDLAGWAPHLTVSINLSPAQMRSPTLISTIVQSLARTGVDAQRICLEITESVLMQDSEANIETLHKLRGLGLQIALDDFGTGYSSLNYLRSFPFNKIKIDRCFVSEIDTREDCRAIVRSVVSLARSLGMAITAEGVERPEQVNCLQMEGCAEVQGYLYSKAVPVGELSDLRAPRELKAATLLSFSREAGEAAKIPEGSQSRAKAA